MDSETDTDSVAESTTGDKVVFTAAMADGLDITEEALALEVANFDENWGNYCNFTNPLEFTFIWKKNLGTVKIFKESQTLSNGREINLSSLKKFAT